MELIIVHPHTSIIKKDALVLGKGPTQRLDDVKLTAEAKYSINFTSLEKIFCLSLLYNESNSFSFGNGIKIYQLKARPWNKTTSVT